MSSQRPIGPQKRHFNHSNLDSRLLSHTHSTLDYTNETALTSGKKTHKAIKESATEPVNNSAWADSDDDDSKKIHLGANKYKKLRTHVKQRTMSTGEFVTAQRQRFEDVFQTPDWAKVEPVEKPLKKEEVGDDDDGSSDDSDKDEKRGTSVWSDDDDDDDGDDGNDHDDHDDEKDEKEKKEKKTNSEKKQKVKEEIKQEIKEETTEETTEDIKEVITTTTTTTKKNKRNREKKQSGGENNGTIIELEVESDDILRQQQQIDHVHSLAQLEKLFSTSRSFRGIKKVKNRNPLLNGTLPPKHLDIHRGPDANASASTSFVVNSIGFHDNNQLMFTAGQDKALRLFQMDGVNNPCIQSTVFELMPIFKAGFINHQTEIMCTGRRTFFHVVNLETAQVIRVPDIKGRGEKSLDYWKASNNSTMIAIIGDNSTILIISAITKQFICEIKCKAGLNDLCWSLDDQYIFSTGNDGSIYCFHVGQRRQVFSFRDAGVSIGSALDISPNGKYFATGSTNGVVNVYDTNFEELINSKKNDYTQDSFASYYGAYTAYEDNVKLPLAEITSLTTKIEHIKFSPSSEMMVIASRNKKDAFKVVHMPSGTTYTNWPTQFTPFSYVQDIAFSADNRKMAVSNDKGKVLLYDLFHYRTGSNIID
jgi:U3 small nucleolar RNA-associated protein 18